MGSKPVTSCEVTFPTFTGYPGNGVPDSDRAAPVSMETSSRKNRSFEAALAIQRILEPAAPAGNVTSYAVMVSLSTTESSV